MSSALGDVVPHIIIQSLHLRVGEFESHLAKRLSQQYLPQADIEGSLDQLVSDLLNVQRHFEAERRGSLEIDQ